MLRFIKYCLGTIFLIVAVVFPWFYAGCIINADQTEPSTGLKTDVSRPTLELKEATRKMWSDHIALTRNAMLCQVDKLPDTERALKQVLQKEVEMGNAIKPYYGEETGQKLTALLHTHTSITSALVNAAKYHDTEALRQAKTSWEENADELADFYSAISPNCPGEGIKQMMNNHLKLTTAEALQRIKMEFNTDILSYEKLRVDILKMSDALADCITDQFPDKFSTAGVYGQGNTSFEIKN